MADENQRMTRNTLILMPAKVLEGVLLMAMNALYTRWFAAEIFGEYNLVTTSVLVLFLVTSAWLYNSAARFVSDYKSDDEKRQFYSTFVIAFAVISAFVVAAGAIIGVAASNILFFYGALMLTTYSLFTIMNGMLIQTGKIAFSIIVSLLSVSGKIICALVLKNMSASGAPSVALVIFAAIIADVIASSVAMRVLKIVSYTKIRAFSKKLLRELLKFGVPLIGMSIGVGLLSMIDRFIVNAVMGSASLGIYAANYTISSGIFGMITAAAVRATYPALIAGYNRGGRGEAETLLSHGLRLYLLIAAPAAVGLCAVCAPLAQFMLAPEYHAGAIVIGITALAYFAMGLTEYAIKGYELTRKTKPVLVFSLIASAIKIVATFALIPIFGIQGAAYGTLIAFISYFLIVVISMRPIFTFKLQKKSTMNIFIAALMCFLAAFLTVKFLPTGALLKAIAGVSAGGIAYFLTIGLTGEIKQELGGIKKALKRH